MYTVPESQVGDGRAPEIDYVGVLVDAFVPPSRWQRELKAFVSPDEDAADFDVGRCDAVWRYSGEVPQHLLDCIRHQLPIHEEFPAMRGALREEAEHPGQHPRDSVKTGLDEEPANRNLLLKTVRTVADLRFGECC